MAFTTSISKKTVHGDQNVVEALVTADAADGQVNVGFSTITHVMWAEKSMTSALAKVKANASTEGVLNISGVASGDEMYVTIYGR